VFVHPPRSNLLRGFIAFSLTLCVTVVCSVAGAADGSSVGNGSAPPALGGKQIFEARCAACHGADGRGGPGRQLLKVDLPDFTDCAFASREPDADFAAVIHGGGPARGFSALMPAHGQASSQAEMDEINARLSGGGEPGPALGTGLDQAGIARVIAYLRSFCSDERWPRGELNLPRPLITEKAFPEDEVVITTFANVNREGFVSNHLLFEKRIGPRAMVEMDLPVTSREWERGGRTEWYSGAGDFAIGTKYAFFHSLESGSIASLGAELKVPTGDDERGLGNGSVVFEPYLAAGQFLPWDSFVQMQLLGEIPTSGAGEISLRGTLGTTFTPILHGRTFSPMVEVIGVFALGRNSEENLDIVPQIQIPLNRRQHVRLNVGVWIPATRNDSRPTRVGAYLLWDWFDGGLFEGW
jgi:mono/diheme cytochrome c family protein